jgi:hypothetical protein
MMIARTAATLGKYRLAELQRRTADRCAAMHGSGNKITRQGIAPSS